MSLLCLLYSVYGLPSGTDAHQHNHAGSGTDIRHYHAGSGTDAKHNHAGSGIDSTDTKHYHAGFALTLGTIIQALALMLNTIMQALTLGSIV